MADWSAISKWHHNQSIEITKQITAAKKQRAAAMGITGNESILSSKRKVNEEASHEEHSTTPSKKLRGSEPTSNAAGTGKETQQSSLFTQAQKPSTPAKDHSQTSNLFGNVLNKSTSPSKNAGPQDQAASSGFKPSTFGSSSTKDSTPKSGFQVPAFGSSTPKKDVPTPGFQVPSFGSSAPKTGSATSGFQVPAFGKSAPTADTSSKSGPSTSGFQVPSFGSSSGSSDLLSQFAKRAKTAEQLTMERKNKAMDEDFDSDEESKEEWSARWDKEEAERLANEKKQTASAPAFKLSKAPADAETSSPFSISKPATGTSTPAGLFGSRFGSPAPSTSGGLSVFDTPKGASTPGGSNIFGHLSPALSPANQDASDDEDEESEEESQAQSQADNGNDSVQSTTPPTKGKELHDSDDDSDETLEETMRRKNQAPAGSLLSRITRDKPAESSDNDDGSTTPKANGSATTPNKYQFFDFGKAATASTTPSMKSSAGDHTFKFGSPIKFSTPGDNKENKDGKSNPTFSFQPATPSPAEFSETPKPAPFSFLAAQNAGQSGPGSTASSLFSSRATTPMSEAETSGKDSAENDDEEGNHGQLDLSELTADEKSENEILFSTTQAIAKHQIEKDGRKQWSNFARGPLWILKNNDSGKAFVRMRIQSGATPLNYAILPQIKAKVAGASKKMVLASRPGDDGKLSSLYFAVKNSDVAEEFAAVYNSNLPA